LNPLGCAVPPCATSLLGDIGCTIVAGVEAYDHELVAKVQLFRYRGDCRRRPLSRPGPSEGPGLQTPSC
jgi:hypothetical protein